METGFFGKVPTHGDFVSRRLDAHLIETWDRWLQDGLVASRSELGDEWLEAYLSSPLWHFAIGPQAGLGAALIGVLMPSIDRVGRHFPLTLACALPAGTDVAAVVRANGAWYARVDELARSALTAEFTLDAFDAALQAPELLPDTLSADFAVDDRPLSGARLQTLEPGEDLSGALVRHAPELLGGVLPNRSLWWTEGVGDAPLLVLQPGLPPPEAFKGLLTGAWP